MVSLGKYNRLRVTRLVDFGAYLDGQGFGEILLPRRYVPKGCQPEDELEVFLYLDSEDRLIATTDRPKVIVGECACLKVVDTSRHGAFLDWGLPKDLLVPRNEQMRPLEAGQWVVVYVGVDERTESIIGSTRLSHHLSELGYYYKPGQAVELLIYGRSDLGYKAVINHTHLGLLYDTEVFRPLRTGDRVDGYIKQIRPDRKIDLSLRLPGVVVEDAVAQKILDYLHAHGGHSDFSDKASPERIYAEFHVSKSHFKRALGLLYKEGRIVLTKERISLSE